MKFSDTLLVLILHFIEPILLAVFFSVILSLGARFFLGPWSLKVRSVSPSLLFAFAFPPLFVGFGAGYIAGYSSTSVLGSVLSGALGILGGGLVYALGQSSDAQPSGDRSLKFAFLAVAFVSGLMLGVQHGLFTKGRFDQEARIKELEFREELAQRELTKALVFKERYYQSYLDMLSKITRDEAAVTYFRANLGLPMPDLTSRSFVTLPVHPPSNKSE